MIAHKIKKIISFLTSKKNLPAIFSLLLLLVVLPATLAVVKISQDLRKKAAEPISYPPSYPPHTSSPTPSTPSHSYPPFTPILVTPPPTPSPTPTCQPEELTVPFKNGTNGVATKNAYQGQTCFPISVSGIGQASGTAYSDAFYVYTDYSGKSLQTPIHYYNKPFNWTLWINGGSAEKIIKGNQVPPYNSNHVYTFTICLPAPGFQVINFSVGDTYTPDNSGNYTIKTCLSTPPPTPTPTPLPSPPAPPPTPTCKTGVNSFTVNTPCFSGRYRYAEFTCYDGYYEKVGSPSSCKTSADWRSYAEQKCYGHSSCFIPTPSPSPINHPPKITTKIQANQIISVTQNTSKSYSVSVSDPENQDIKLSLNQSPQSPVFTELVPTRTKNQYRLILRPTSKTTTRTYTIALKATDSGNPPTSSSISFKIKVARRVLLPFCDRFPFLFWCR